MSSSRTEKECLMEAREALSLFSHDELKQYTKDVFETAKTYPKLRGVDAIKKAMEEVGNLKVEQLTERMQTEVNDIAKLDKMSADVKDKKATVLEFIARRYKNLAYNIESAQRSARKLLGNAFFNQLTQEEFAFAARPQNDLEIIRAIDGKKVENPLAKEVAKKFHDYIAFRNGEMVTSNALPIHHLNKDRYLRAIHDRSLLTSGGQTLINLIKAGRRMPLAKAKQIWRDFIKEHLDIEKTFAETPGIGVNGKAVESEIDKILEDIFDNITTDKQELFNEGRGGNRMFFYWKDMEAMYNYAQKYGKKDLFSNIMGDVNASGNKIGMTQIFGTKPQTTFNEISKIQDKVDNKGSSWNNRTKRTFEHLAGIDQAPVNATIANFAASIRALTSMKSLGKLATLSLSDVGNGIAFAKRWGFDYWGSYTDYMDGLFNALPSEDRKFIAGMFKESTDHHMGYVANFLEAKNVPQFLQSASVGFFRITGMEALDKGNKVSALYVMSKGLGKLSKHSFEELPESTLRQFAKYDFTSKEWDALRSKNQRGLFTIDNVEKLTNDDIRNIYGVTNSDQPLYQFKNDLYRKVYSMFDVSVENAVVSPGAFIRANLYGDTRAGTITGELFRMVMQFKGFALQHMDRVLYQGFKDADSAQAKLSYALHLTMATLPMSYLSYVLNNWESGRSMPSWDAMNFSEKSRYAFEMLSPSEAIFSRILDPEQSNSDLLMNMAGGPSIRMLLNAMQAPIALAGGDVKKFKKAAKKLGQGVNPAATLPFISPYLNELMGEKSYLQPGQQQYWGA